MYGGYDGSASQFAGQGGFLPTPAGGATAGADGAAGGAVRVFGTFTSSEAVAHRNDDIARGNKTCVSFACSCVPFLRVTVTSHDVFCTSHAS